MKEFFKSVEFPELENKTVSCQETKRSIDFEKAKKEMTGYHTHIIRMIDAIQSGASNITGPKNIKGTPFFATLDRMNLNPTKETISLFLDIARQDIGVRFRQECEIILKGEEFPILKKLVYE